MLVLFLRLALLTENYWNYSHNSFRMQPATSIDGNLEVNNFVFFQFTVTI